MYLPTPAFHMYLPTPAFHMYLPTPAFHMYLPTSSFFFLSVQGRHCDALTSFRIPLQSSRGPSACPLGSSLHAVFRHPLSPVLSAWFFYLLLCVLQLM
jgi:hypothetical protein